MTEKASVIYEDLDVFDAETITNLYLYGTYNLPDNLFDRVKSKDYLESLIDNEIQLHVDGFDLMESGAGRNISPAYFPIVDSFFSSDSISPGI